MSAERFEFVGSGGKMLPAVIWQPRQTRAVLQIAHGMTEHMGRYEAFAAELNAQGIAVAGFDLRGHGENAGDREVASLGMGGWWASVEDMQLFQFHLQEMFPSVPHVLLGFSLGSFLLRDYLNTYSTENLAGAVIMGTGHQPGWLLTIIMELVAGQIKKVGYDETSDLVKQLSFGTYNKKFKPNRTEADWLCANTDALDAYLADPLVRKNISAGLFWELLGSMKRRSGKTEYDRWDKKLPILLLSGGDDPVGDGGKGVAAIHQQMQKSGLTDVAMKLIPGARHDLLHEKTEISAEAMKCLTDWLEARFAK